MAEQRISLDIPRRNTAAPTPDMTAFLSLGFRPLYIAGCGWALIAIVLWIFLPNWLQPPLNGVAWHAHEMLWGFIATIAVGFLLTASATWTGHNPLKSKGLALLCGLWLLARIGFLAGGQAAFTLALLAETAFFLLSAILLMHVMIKGRSRRNYGVPLLVAGLGVSNVLFLLAALQGNYTTLMQHFNLGLICMAVIALLIARRVIPFFSMRMVPGLELPMQVRSGQFQLITSVLAIVFGLIGQNQAMAAALLVTGAISLWQLLRWKPVAVLHKPMLWILYLGYAFMGLGLILAALHIGQIGGSILFARAATHAHTIGMGGFAILIIGMVTRTALGHLGRPLALDTSMLASYYLMMAAVVLRLAALWPTAGSLWLLRVSAVCWISCMALYLWRFVPMLIRPRPDQKTN
jgi:uncharacterized protein involved in response to NO